jgi:mRNA interferase MazF
MYTRGLFPNAPLALLAMPIPYVPDEWEVLDCDFGGLRAPELNKPRPIVVVSKPFKSRRDLCTVIALSTTTPRVVEAFNYRLAHKPLATQDDVWAKGDMIMAVSRFRLSGYWFAKHANGNRKYERIFVHAADRAGISAAIRSILV